VALSDGSSAVTLPPSVTVSAGATSRTFTATTSGVAAQTAATISATAGGTTRTATLTVNPPTPVAPTLRSPANGASGVTQPLTLDWDDVANATGYEVRVDDSSSMSSPYVANPTVSTSQVVLTGVPARQLWWRVRARNAAGIFGPFSTTRSFTPQAGTATASLAALSVSPTSVTGGTSATGTVTLTAPAPPGGSTVTLTSSDSALSVPSGVTVPAGLSSATFTASTTIVAAQRSVILTATSAGVSRTATLSIAPPSSGTLAAPALLAPANDARINRGQPVVFDWSDVAGAAGYTIVIDNRSSFSSPTVLATVSTSTYVTSTLPRERMWWRTRAVDGSGAPGAWSSSRQFEVR
jgi:hypothetical protein